MPEKLKLFYKSFTAELKHTFTVAIHSRTTTPLVLTEIHYGGFIGYGEASMPPYLGESQESVINFLSLIDLSQFNNPFELDKILKYVDSISSGNSAAKASVDIALHDLIGKLLNKPLFSILGLTNKENILSSYTIGIDSNEIIRKKVIEAEEYKILKIKLGTDKDKEIINTIREITDKPLTIDANQGWTTKEHALEMINWLNDNNVLFIEQPMPKNIIDDMAWVTELSPLPTIADESCQRLSDIKRNEGVFSGINIKLMKSTGLREAYKMTILAKALNMKIMLGCMTETSCAISAASQLAMEADWVDLDGAVLIKNDIFEGTKLIDGKIVLSNLPGIGVKPLITK